MSKGRRAVEGTNTSPLFPKTEACTFGQLHRLRYGHFDERSPLARDFAVQA